MNKRIATPDSIHSDSANTLDRTEFAAQLNEAFPRLWLMAAAIVGDRTQAEDIVQEAVLIAYQKLADFSPGTNLTAWLAQIVRYLAANYVRKISNRGTNSADPQILDKTVGSHKSTHETASILGSRGQLDSDQPAFDDDTVRALNLLGEEARCCVLLRVVQQLSYDEISQLLQIPAGTAMSHVHRGKKTMREFLTRAMSIDSDTSGKPR